MRSKLKNARYYVNEQGSFMERTGTGRFKEAVLIRPTHVSCVEAENIDLESVSIAATGLSREAYYLFMATLGIDWLKKNRKMTEHEALYLFGMPMVLNWWHNHFFLREKMLSARLVDYFDKRLKLQLTNGKEPKLQRLAAQNETCDFWMRMHAVCLDEHSWQHRRLAESYVHIKCNCQDE